MTGRTAQRGRTRYGSRAATARRRSSRDPRPRHGASARGERRPIRSRGRGDLDGRLARRACDTRTALDTDEEAVMEPTPATAITDEAAVVSTALDYLEGWFD